MRYKKIISRLRVSKENLYDWGLYLSIIIGWIEIIFWPDRFENKCNEFFYIFVFGVVVSFFSIIPIYYEYDIRKEKAFRAYLLGYIPGGSSIIFIPSFIITISKIIDIFNDFCLSYWLYNHFLLFIVFILCFVVFLLTIYLLIKFFLKAIEHMFK
jgi:hypothetical protein